jgi:hypothetical protein
MDRHHPDHDTGRTNLKLQRSQMREIRQRDSATHIDRWASDGFYSDARQRPASPMTQAINADPRQAERLRLSRQQAREGEVHWGIEDETESEGDASE